MQSSQPAHRQPSYHSKMLIKWIPTLNSDPCPMFKPPENFLFQDPSPQIPDVWAALNSNLSFWLTETSILNLDSPFLCYNNRVPQGRKPKWLWDSLHVIIILFPSFRDHYLVLSAHQFQTIVQYILYSFIIVDFGGHIGGEEKAAISYSVIALHINF